ILTTAAVSIERCHHVSRRSHAFNHPFLENNPIQYLPLAFIASASIAMNIPFFFNTTLCDDGSITLSAFGQAPGYTVFLWIRLITIKFVPLLLVVIVNSILIVLIIRSNLKSQTSSEVERTKIRISAMLVSISAVYVSCHVMEPFTYSAIYGVINGADQVHNEAHMTLMAITNILELFSMTCNFVFYCIFYKPFQATLGHMFKRCSSQTSTNGLGEA
ncbi:hypothetical protein CAPTEDRAFT_210740, partial [Capitella teleta]